jgi:hypothetical protein
MKILIPLLLLTGCATGVPGQYNQYRPGTEIRPVVDYSGPVETYEADLRACNDLSKQVASSTDNALAGAIGGALLGATFAAAMSSKEYTRELAQTGALTGLLKGGATDDRKGIVARCLSGRGYRVLG